MLGEITGGLVPSSGDVRVSIHQEPDRRPLVQELGTPLAPSEIPAIPGLEVATGALLVAGDAASANLAGCFSDVFALRDSFALVCGDVYGRGGDVASLAAAAKSLLRREASRNPGQGSAAREVSRLLASSAGEQRRLELLYARFHPGSGRLTLCRCGGWPPLLLSGGGARLLGSQRPWPVAWRSHGCQQSEVTLRAGDVFVGYTSGIPEARRDRDRILGIDSVRRLLEHHRNERPKTLVSRILRLVSDYARAPFADDAVVLVARADTR